MSRRSCALRSPLLAGIVSSILTTFLLGNGIALARQAAEAAAANTVNSLSIVNDSVQGIDIKNGTVASADVRDDSLTTYDVLNNSLRGSDLADGSVRGVDVEDSTLTGADVQNNTLAGSDIGDGSVRDVDLAADAVPHWARINAGPSTSLVSGQGVTGLTRYDDTIYSIRIPGVTASTCSTMFQSELFVSGSAPTDVTFAANPSGAPSQPDVMFLYASRALTDSEGFTALFLC